MRRDVIARMLDGDPPAEAPRLGRRPGRWERLTMRLFAHGKGAFEAPSKGAPEEGATGRIDTPFARWDAECLEGLRLRMKQIALALVLLFAFGLAIIAMLNSGAL